MFLFWRSPHLGGGPSDAGPANRRRRPPASRFSTGPVPPSDDELQKARKRLQKPSFLAPKGNGLNRGKYPNPTPSCQNCQRMPEPHTTPRNARATVPSNPSRLHIKAGEHQGKMGMIGQPTAIEGPGSEPLVPSLLAHSLLCPRHPAEPVHDPSAARMLQARGLSSRLLAESELAPALLASLCNHGEEAASGPSPAAWIGSCLEPRVGVGDRNDIT